MRSNLQGRRVFSVILRPMEPSRLRVFPSGSLATIGGYCTVVDPTTGSVLKAGAPRSCTLLRNDSNIIKDQIAALWSEIPD